MATRKEWAWEFIKRRAPRVSEERAGQLVDYLESMHDMEGLVASDPDYWNDPVILVGVLHLGICFDQEMNVRGVIRED